MSNITCTYCGEKNHSIRTCKKYYNYKNSLCKTCGRPIKKYNDRWYHYNYMKGSDGYESHSFETHVTIGSEDIKCKECGNIEHKLKACKNPEPQSR